MYTVYCTSTKKIVQNVGETLPLEPYTLLPIRMTVGMQYIGTKLEYIAVFGGERNLFRGPGFYLNDRYNKGLAEYLIGYKATAQQRRKTLALVLQNEDTLLRLADTFYWRDGSDGYINLSNLNHWLNRILDQVYEDVPYAFSSVETLRHELMYQYGSNDKTLAAGKSYLETYKEQNNGKPFKYCPREVFTW